MHLRFPKTVESADVDNTRLSCPSEGAAIVATLLFVSITNKILSTAGLETPRPRRPVCRDCGGAYAIRLKSLLGERRSPNSWRTRAEIVSAVGYIRRSSAGLKGTGMSGAVSRAMGPRK